jgi:tRNA-2-methylthio-N6-dimethylallyladenosine synthase
MHGRSPWLQAVHFEGSPELAGQIVDVAIKGATLNSLSGDLAGQSKEVAA